MDPNILRKIARQKPEAGPIKIWARASEISPEMVGYTFAVHNGKNFIEVKVNEDMIGHRFGEFAPTRKFIRHGGKMQKELEKKMATSGSPATNSKK